MINLKYRTFVNIIKKQIVERKRLFTMKIIYYEEENLKKETTVTIIKCSDVYGKIHIEKSPASRDELHQISKEFYILLNISTKICRQQTFNIVKEICLSILCSCIRYNFILNES